jgi:hypothetical protein
MTLPWLPRPTFTDTGPTQNWEFGTFGRRDDGPKKGGTVKTLL